jgi:hypothetical protein
MYESCDAIFLIYRFGEIRYIVGILEKDIDKDNVLFRYLIKEDEAKQIGFTPYIAFSDLTKIYTENVLDTFGRRLTNPVREDISEYYDFWEVELKYQKDKWYLLAQTQGITIADNFEFLAYYRPISGLSFISEICPFLVLPYILSEGDMLDWEVNFKNDTVSVFKNDIFLGFVKMFHSSVFFKSGLMDLKIVVKHIFRDHVFIKVYDNLCVENTTKEMIIPIR